MTIEHGPVYGVPLIDTLPLGSGGMLQAMPSRDDLRQVQRVNERVVAGYEVLLAHYGEKTEENDRMATAIRHALANVLAAVAKRADAPMSSETHLDSAIAQLASVTAWRPADRELLAIIDDAVAHMEMLSVDSSSSEGI